MGLFREVSSFFTPEIDTLLINNHFVFDDKKYKFVRHYRVKDIDSIKESTESKDFFITLRLEIYTTDKKIRLVFQNNNKVLIEETISDEQLKSVEKFEKLLDDIFEEYIYNFDKYVKISLGSF